MHTKRLRAVTTEKSHVLMLINKHKCVCMNVLSTLENSAKWEREKRKDVKILIFLNGKFLMLNEIFFGVKFDAYLPLEIIFDLKNSTILRLIVMD